MRIEIDQSGRIEETNRDTVLAFSNGKSFTVLIRARTKRRLLERFRFIGMPKLFTLRTFSAGIFLLLEGRINCNDEVVIDIEYAGNNLVIKDMLKEMYNRHGKLSDIPRITFKQIGRKSRAHEMAIGVFRKTKKADRVIEYDKLEKIATKKSR